MVKNVIGGMVTGAFFSAVALGAASVMAPQPERQIPPGDAADVERVVQGDPAASAPAASDSPAPGASGAPAVATVPPTPQETPPAPDSAALPEPEPERAARPAMTPQPSEPAAPDAATPGTAPQALTVPPMKAPVTPPVASLQPGTESTGPLIDGLPGQPQTDATPVAETPSAAAPQPAPQPAPDSTTPDNATPDNATPDNASDDSATPEPEPAPTGPILPEIRRFGTAQPQATPDAQTAPGQDATSPEDEAEARRLARTPLYANAALAPRETGLPLLAIVMIDSDDIGMGVEQLNSLPVPVSIAVQATKPTASMRLNGYRKTGFEVLALADFPAGSTVQDAAVMAEASFLVLPDTIGMFSPDMTTLDMEAVQTLSNILARDGRALVSQDMGMVRSAAERAELRLATVYRDIDQPGQDAAAIRRMLDQAAFEARNRGNVVVMARMQPDTLSAIDLWSMTDNAESVQVVPVSAILKK